MLHIEPPPVVGIETRIIGLMGFLFPWKQEIESQLSPQASGHRAGAGNTRKQRYMREPEDCRHISAFSLAGSLGPHAFPSAGPSITLHISGSLPVCTQATL